MFGFAQDGRVYSASSDTMLASAPQGASPWPADADGAQTEAALYALLQPYGLGASINPAPSQATLLEYANAKQWTLATGGFTVKLGTAARTFATDTIGQTLIAGKDLRLSKASPPTDINWQFGTNDWQAISATDLDAVATKIADFVQATFDALKIVEAAIMSDTITTTAQINSAAWPSSALSEAI